MLPLRTVASEGMVTLDTCSRNYVAQTLAHRSCGSERGRVNHTSKLAFALPD